MSAKSAPRRGWEAFARPAQVNQRRYEAVRAYVLEDAPLAESAARFGYSPPALASLVRDFRAGKLALFAEAGRPGRKSAPKKDAARGRVIELRRQGLSVHEISARLAAEGRPLNRTGVGQILAEEGFGRLLRHPEPEASISPATAGRDTRLPRARVIDFASFPAAATTRLAGLLLAVPDLAALDLPALARAAGYPGTKAIPAASWLLNFLAALDQKLIAAGLASGDQGIFDLDFHAVMHWGHDPVLEKHYVPTRSQRARSVLTFFAQDSGTHNLVYANAGISKATQHREVIAFCDHWKQVSGHYPKMLVMDQNVTNQKILGELDGRGVKFLTLRMRSPALIRHINSQSGKDYKTITLDRPGPHNKPKVHEDKAVKLTSYPGTVRQLIVTGLRRDAPTVIITNDDATTVRALIERYARRMTIEQRLAEIIRAFTADALSSTVNLNVDLDIMLAVLAQALLAALRDRLPGYHAATPDTIQRRFLETPGQIITTSDTITIRLERRAYSPVLRKAGLPPATTISWLGNRAIH